MTLNPSNDSRSARLTHALIGASYGLLTGASFAFAASFANPLLHQDLPLGVAWDSLARYFLLAGLGLALIGASTCWATEPWIGILWGTITAGGLILLGALSQSQEVALGTKMLVLVFTLFPVAAMALPVAWTLRRLADSHAGAKSLTHPSAKIFSLAMIAFVVGAGSGYFMKMPPRALQAVRFVDGMIQSSASDGESILRRLPAFEDQLDREYKLYEAPSQISTEGFIVTAVFEGGYTFECLVIVYPGREPYLSRCEAGDSVSN